MAIFCISNMAVNRHLGFYRIGNSTIRSAFPEIPIWEPNMEWIGCTVCEIFALKLYCDLEAGVWGHWRSSKVTLFDSLHMVSYYRLIVTLCLKCTVFKIWRHIGRKSPKKTYPTLIWHVRLGWPLANFSTTHTLPETRIMGLSAVYISQSCFRSARHNTGVWQTDGRTDRQTSLSQRRAIAYMLSRVKTVAVKGQ